jgi:hypothetical protein
MRLDSIKDVSVSAEYLNTKTKLKLINEVEELEKKATEDKNRIVKIQKNIDNILEKMLEGEEKALKTYGETIKNLSTSIEAINKQYLSNNQYKILGASEIVSLQVKWAKEEGDTNFLNKLEEWNNAHVRLR